MFIVRSPRLFARVAMASVACALLASATLAEEDANKKPNAAPKEAVGFVGTLEGDFVAKKANGNTVTLKVTKVTAADNSTAKDSAKLVGTDVVVTVRWEKVDGKYQPMKDDAKFVKGLKTGDSLALKVEYLESLEVLRMTEAPRKAAAEAAKTE